MLILLSANCFLAIEVLTIKGVFSCALFVIASVNLAYLTLVHSVKSSFKDHGGVNRIPLIALIVICNVLYLVFRALLCCFRRNKKATMLVLILIALTATPYIYFTRIWHSCSGWDKGLSGRKIDSGVSNCIIAIPDTCTYVEWAGVFDVYRFSLPCSWKTSSFDVNKLAIGDKSRRIGFPRTENWPLKDKLSPAFS